MGITDGQSFNCQIVNGIDRCEASTTLTTASAKNKRITATTAPINVTLPATTVAGHVFNYFRTDRTGQTVTILGTIDGVAGGCVLQSNKSVEMRSATVSGAYENWVNS